MSITERIDNVTTLTDEYAKTKPPVPKSVKIELTGRCNFECVFCARAQRLRTVSDMDKDLFKRLLREMRSDGIEEIGMFYLGESMLVDWLPEAVKFAKDLGYPYIFLTTNGSVASAAKLDAVMAAGLDSLKFSCNYADEAQFKDIARVSGKLFHRMKSNMKLAYEIREAKGYKTKLYASYIEYDGEQGEKMKDTINEMKPFVDEIYALPLYNQAALIAKQDWNFVAGNRGRAGNLRPPLPCWSIFTEGHIAFDGTLSACCFDHDKRFAMGDLTKEKFMDAWHSPRFQNLREHHLRKNVCGSVCEKCVAYA